MPHCRKSLAYSWSLSADLMFVSFWCPIGMIMYSHTTSLWMWGVSGKPIFYEVVIFRLLDRLRICKASRHPCVDHFSTGPGITNSPDIQYTSNPQITSNIPLSTCENHPHGYLGFQALTMITWPSGSVADVARISGEGGLVQANSWG